MRESTSQPRQNPPRGGRKVGPKPVFTADGAVAAAVAEGIDRFTLSAVAKRLGVATPAIYRLFASREDLVIACLDAAGATLSLPEPGMHWRDVLLMWADEAWRVCEEFPGLSRVVYSYPAAPTRIQGVFSAYADSLAVHDKTSAQAMFAIQLIATTVFASHWGVEAVRAVDEHGKTGLDTVRDAIGEGESLLRPDESWTGRQAMDNKVAVVLAGLEHHWPEA